MFAKLKTSLTELSRNDLHAVMCISIDQAYQDDTAFKLFSDMINRNKACLSQLTIVIADNLKRHYVALQENLAPKAAEKKAHDYGVQWLTHNKVAIDDIEVPTNINFWKDLKTTKSFQKSLQTTMDEYSNNVIFKTLTDTVSLKFAKKLHDKLIHTHKQITITECIKATTAYCLEESSIFTELIALGANLQLYPGKWNKAMEYMYNKYTTGDPMPWLEYRFRKNLTK
jgi:hypothetical protein